MPRPVLGRQQGEGRAQRAPRAGKSAKSMGAGAQYGNPCAALTEPHPRHPDRKLAS
jgi:hypothetical protein